VSNFGKQCGDVLSRFEGINENDSEIRLVKAQLDFCIEKEMVKTATDFFVRRIGLLYFDLPLLRKVSESCLQVMTIHFNWSEARLKEEKKELNRLIDLAQNF
jgi:glycerol-3-phosphate dehydrogenase